MQMGTSSSGSTCASVWRIALPSMQSHSMRMYTNQGQPFPFALIAAPESPYHIQSIENSQYFQLPTGGLRFLFCHGRHWHGGNALWTCSATIGSQREHLSHQDWSRGVSFVTQQLYLLDPDGPVVQGREVLVVCSIGRRRKRRRLS
eukprot:5550780-Pleurochrysis_carterae.AAC.1